MPVQDRLFQPMQVGSIQISQRIIMAPLTRFRANDNHVPTPMMEEYYKQRASVPGTLLTTEATVVAPQALGYPNSPRIWSKEQVEGWTRITKAVHSSGSFIFLQLWAVGRNAIPSFMEGRGLPVISSGTVRMPLTLRLGGVEVTPALPKALSEGAIQSFIHLYVNAAKNAVTAGFDGVEIHAAGGYLIDQFTQEASNNRTDRWGGSIENRSRFGFEVARAVSSAIGSNRTAVRISPFNTVNGMGVGDVVSQFSDFVSRLRSLGLAYLHVIGSGKDTEGVMPADKLGFLIDLWNVSPVFLNGGFQPQTARRTVNGFADRDIGIVFGRHFISNPDLVYRVKHDLPLNVYDPTTFYLAKSTRGYIDYPFSEEFEQAQKDNANMV